MKMANFNTYIDETVDIKFDYQTKDVVVIQNSKDIFRRPATEQNISLAHSIYMGAKYREVAQSATN